MVYLTPRDLTAADLDRARTARLIEAQQHLDQAGQVPDSYRDRVGAWVADGGPRPWEPPPSVTEPGRRPYPPTPRRRP